MRYISLVFIAITTLIVQDTAPPKSTNNPRLQIKASVLISKPEWRPLDNKPCPISVDQAIGSSLSQLKKEHTIDTDRLSVSCVLSSSVPEVRIIQDLENGEMFIPTQPRYWLVNFRLASIDARKGHIIDEWYAVGFDGEAIDLVTAL